MTWVAAVSVMPTPPAMMLQIATRTSGSFWKRSTASIRCSALSDPEIVTHSSQKTALCLFNPSQRP